MNIIIDYGVGNLDSVQNGFKFVGMDTLISSDPALISIATSLILPGVGAFGDAMDALKKSGLIPFILEHVSKGKYLFGICLGMQLLYESSDEYGLNQGLGLLKGTCRYLDISFKVPHMGWNSLTFNQPSNPLLKYINERDYVYFVHSYYVKSSGQEIVASTQYEINIPAIVMQKNIVATQFHPEKSGTVGLKILKAYGELIQ
ncbi:MAG: imidazole glycerol phosphate synthase subunit HisH [Candidatus Izemoplasmatales bacterium]|nr:imidazole glycerol phosphate synthase subunit HisH [bacterium]MDZ4195741.1 imidazole glycerol phosphate synthase subunit HisH [Candidatus Izemoplasmatales bacterium]